MNFRTAAEQVLRETNRPAADLAKAKIALQKAISVLRKDGHFSWLSGEFSLYLTAGKSDYGPGEGQASGHRGMPHSLLSLDRRLRYVALGDTSTEYRWVDRVGPHELLDRYRTSEGFVLLDSPRVYAYEDKKLKFAPTPDTTGDLIYGRGDVDDGVPVIKWNGTSNVVHTPDGGLPIPDDWSSVWVNEGFDMTVARARAIFVELFVHDERATAEALQAWGDATRAEIGATNRKQGVHRRRLHL